MVTAYHRAVTHQGETVVIVVPDAGVQTVKHLYMWVDTDPLDLHPAQYTDTRLVELGDLVCCGGDEFRVAYMRPGMDGYPFGQIRGESGAWYNTEYAVLLERRL
ncbi:hypothetical protein 13VV501A_gene0019 [Vibrio phage 13VV501A]|nr:hypothetical protein 13VV501A_gene0019 [Vibrio phage 13VV501A]